MKLKLMSVMFLITFFSLFFSIASQDLLCEGRIYDPDQYLTMDKVKHLCTKIKSHPYVMVNIKKTLKNKGNSSPSEDSKRQFNSMCSRLHICKEGSIVSLYIEDHKSYIYVGSRAKNTLHTTKTTEILNKEKETLRTGNYHKAIENMIDQLVSTYYYKFRNNLKFGKPINHNSYYERKQHETINTTNNVPLILTVFILMAVVICVCLALAKRENEEHKAAFENNQPQHYEDHEAQEEVKEHMQFLSKILNDIKNTPGKTLKIDFCMMCMETFVQGKDSLNTTIRRFNCGHLFHHSCVADFNECLLCKGCTDGNNPNLYINQQTFSQPQFNPQNLNYQGHNNNLPAYTDINQPHSNQQLMNASHSAYPQQIPNNNFQPQPNFQNNMNNQPYAQTINPHDLSYFITEAQVLAFIRNFKEIYHEEDLKQYYQNNPKEIKRMESEQGVGVSNMWGYVAVAGGAGLVGYAIGSYANSGHNQQHYNYNPNNNYNHDNYNHNTYTNPRNDEDEDDYNGEGAEGDW